MTKAYADTKASLTGNNTFTGGMTVNGILYNDINGQGYFTQLYHNINSLRFLSRNDYFNGAIGAQLATDIKFYCYDTSKAQKNILTLNPTSATLDGSLSINNTLNFNDSNGLGTTYKGSIIQTDKTLYLKSWNNNILPSSPYYTNIILQTMDASHTVVNSLSISHLQAYFKADIVCPNDLGISINGNDIQAEDNGSEVNVFTQLISPSSLKIGTESVTTEIRGSTITFINPSSSTTMELNSDSIELNQPTTITGSLTTSIGVIYKDQQQVGHTAEMAMSGNALYIRSKNNDSTTTPTYANSIKFYCNNVEKVENNILTLGPSSATLNGGLELVGALYATSLHSVNGLTSWDSSQPANTSYANYIYQGGSIMTILVRNINLNTPTATQLQFSLYDATKTQRIPMTIHPTIVNITGDLSVNGNTYTKILQSNDNGGSSLYFGQILMNSGVYIIKAMNISTGNATSIQFNTCNTSNAETATMVLNNNNIQLNQPTTITGNLNVTGTLTANNSPVITSLTDGTITSATQNGPNTTGLSYTFVLGPYYSDSISVSCPIASIGRDIFYHPHGIHSHRISSITCIINKNGSTFFNSPVVTNETLPIIKSTELYSVPPYRNSYNYNFKQYFLNANASFHPTYENSSSTYTVTFTVSGYGNFEYNTTTVQTENGTPNYYGFERLKNGFNSTNFSTGTSYINSIKTNKIILNGLDLQTQLTTVSTQISGMETQISGLETHITIVSNEISSMQTQISNMSTQISNMSTQISNLSRDVDNLKNRTIFG